MIVKRPELITRAPTSTNGKNGNSKKREQTAARIIKAIGETNGLLTVAAAKAGVSYTTINRYVADFPSVKQAAIDAHERMLDFAEGKLYSKIKAGDNVAILFYLKTQGKARGYIERQEFTGAGGEPIKHTIEVVDQETKKALGEFLNK